MSESTRTFDPKSREILYTFTDDLPKQKIVVNYEEDSLKHFARKLTFKVLGEGIREKNPEGKTIIRRALNAKEILNEINIILDDKFKTKEERVKYELSLHGLYFHLQKLEEIGFIKTIAILKEGRHNVSYYARPAKIVLFKDTFKEDENVNKAFNSMMRLLLILYPDIDTKDFMQFYERYNEINKKSLDQIQRKIGEIQEQVYEANIDPNDIQKLFALLNQINPEFVELFQEILEFIRIKLW